MGGESSSVFYDLPERTVARAFENSGAVLDADDSSA